MSLVPRTVYPFSAVVGQDPLKLALLLNAIDPGVGGVLVRGEKGTAKSTTVRALAALLPDIQVVEGCRYGCDPADVAHLCDDCRASASADQGLVSIRSRVPFVDLPVSATEDRLVGSLDFESAIREGIRSFQPGLLARANRGILYVDEVNLLDDHLVDTLLDVSAMRVNVVEREGVSVSHPSRFILVGTMNPEEGDLRPQLIDRFGLCVDVRTIRSRDLRVMIVTRRQQFETDPEGFAARWHAEQQSLTRAIVEARERVEQGVAVPDEVLYAIADVCIRSQINGHRADSVMARAAAAHAALQGRSDATLLDVERVAEMVLLHRLHSTPFEQLSVDESSLRMSLRSLLGGGEDSGGEDPLGDGTVPGTGQDRMFEAGTLVARPATHTPDLTAAASPLVRELDRTERSGGGRRQDTLSDTARGRYVRSTTPKEPFGAQDVALDATIRAAASDGASLRKGRGVGIEGRHMRTKVRTRKVGVSIVFCVDTSGSMGATARLDAARAAVNEILLDAYQKRDRVSVVTFRGDSAQTVLAPTTSVEMAGLRLRDVPTGGATPLAAGIMKALEVVEEERRRDPEIVPWIVMVTDGRGNVGLSGGSGGDDALAAAARIPMMRVGAIVLDSGATTGDSPAARLAVAAGAHYENVGTMSGTVIADTVRHAI